MRTDRSVRIVDVERGVVTHGLAVAGNREAGKVRLLLGTTQDDDEMASARRAALDVSREHARELGRTALAAIRSGSYQTSQGRVVDWRDAIDAAVRAKVSIPPDQPLPEVQGTAFDATRLFVVNDTTLSAARYLRAQGYRPLALNFANGKAPGGGFMGGARAQEEGLCRSSALFATLEGDAMYEAHARRARPDSTAWAILSPDVPVFRTAGDALDEPWPLSFITSAAPYTPAIGQPEAGDLLQARIQRVLAIAHAYGYEALVLGAWGCGAFGNDAQRTARDFVDALTGEFAGTFREVVFAVTDWSPERKFLGPFRDAVARVGR